jgi:hypothetical protein
MKRLALLTTFALAASASSAFAWPWAWTRENPDRVHAPDRDVDDTYDRYNDDRYDDFYTHDHYDRYTDSRWERDYRGHWQVLAERYTAQTDRQFINLRGQAGRLHRLRIEAVRGNPVIHQIAIEYTDGNTQVVKLETRLPRGAGEVIRLNPDQPVHRIIVYTEPRFGGAYSIFGT